MAKIIDHLTLTVGVTAYEHEGCQYDALLIIVAYYKGRGFCVSWQPVKLTGYGYQTGPMPSSDPLVNGGAFVAKEATKNSVKTLEQMRTNLEAAREGIKYYFDQRDFDGLKELMGDVANYGYPYDREQQIKQLINNNINNQNSEVMANKTNNNQESVNVQDNAQVENVNVGEMTVDSIMPKMSAEPEEPTKQEVAQAISKAANEGTATTMPLGQHGTLVIASGGGEKSKPRGIMPKVTLKKKTPQPAPVAEQEPDPEAVGELAGMLTRVRLFEYTTSHNEKALGIAGFSGEDDPRWKPIRDERRRLAAEYKKAKAKDPKAKAKSHPIYLSRMMDPATGGWCNTMLLGPRYMDVAKQLCEAYNTDDREAWAKAVQAVKVCKTAISNGFQAERTARRAARKAEREAQSTQPAAPQGKTYTAADMEATIREAFGALAGAMKADVKQFEPLIAAAMKKAA